jgi:hypothetical protein
MDTQPKVQTEMLEAERARDRTSLVLYGLALSSLLVEHSYEEITPDMLADEALRVEAQMLQGTDHLKSPSIDAAAEVISRLVATNQAFASLFREAFLYVRTPQEP